jgi:hypothetical protein
MFTEITMGKPNMRQNVSLLMKRNIRSLAVVPTLLLASSLPLCGAVTGQWDFNSSNMVATAGADLAYRGDTESLTTFSTASIGGQTAVVMGFPAAAMEQGYEMTHGIAPNGGGGYVNQYTLIMDLMFPADSTGKWRGLFQTSPDNGNDGDLFVNAANGIGISGNYSGSLLADTWHRVAFVFDLAATENQLSKYVDGKLVGTQTGSAFGIDGRWSMDVAALLFTDEDGETAAGFVNSIQIHDVPLSAVDLFALGKPTAAGIPGVIPVFTNVTVTVTPAEGVQTAGMTAKCFEAAAVGSGTLTYQWYRNGAALAGKTDPQLRLANIQPTDAGSYTVVVNNGLRSATNTPAATLSVAPAPAAFVSGQWDFNQSDLAATFGQPLQYFDAQVQTDTTFGTTTSFGISDMDGQPVNVMFCNPTSGGAWGGIVVPHGIAPNGGGTNVNQYTVIMDILYPSSTAGYRALWQTDPANASDSEVFFNGANALGISSRYDGELTLDTWHRVALAFDLTKRELGKYIDGVNVVTGPVGNAPLGNHDAQYLSANTDASGGGVDLRWSLGATALLLADEDGEVQPVYVSSVQVRNGRMTDAAIEAMGAPKATKIPGSIKAVQSGNSILIEWTGAVLESASTPAGPWSVVNNAAHPHMVATPTGTLFFRVAR